MKNILKSRYISFVLALLMVVGIFLPCGGALADGGKYNIDIGIKINDKENLKKEVKEGGIIKSSGRQVKVYKLKADKGMTDKQMFDLAKSFHKSGEKELSIKDAEEKLKKDGLFAKDGVLSDKSKLVYDGKFVDEIRLKKGEDPELAKLTEENITIKDLEEGYYLIKETDESKKIANKAINTFVVHISDKTVEDVNGKKVYRIEAKETMPTPKDSLKLIKVDSSNKDVKLSHAQFELYRKVKDGDKEKSELVKVNGSRGKYIYDEKGNTTVLETWENGELVVEGVPEGTYYFKEIKPAPGYPDKDNVNKTSKEMKPGDSDTVENHSTPILKKVDGSDENKTLDGAVFEVYKKDGTKLNFKKTNAGYEVDPNGKDELVTKDKGIINITNLKDGEYTFKEVKAPKGYILSDVKIDFTIKNFNSVDKDGKVKILVVKNKPEKPNPKTPTGGFNFVKIDSTKDENRLGGAKFILMKKVGSNFEKFLVDGKEVRLTSKDNGEFGIDGLEYGEYALKEVEAPENHTIINELTPFTVDAASKSLPAKKIVNEPYKKVVTTSRQNTVTTKYTPSEITRVVKSPLVKTGDIRIVVMAIIGLIFLGMGIKLVNSGERLQRI